MDEFAFQLSLWGNHMENTFWQKRGKEETLPSWRGAEQGRGAGWVGECRIRNHLGVKCTAMEHTE